MLHPVGSVTRYYIVHVHAPTDRITYYDSGSSARRVCSRWNRNAGYEAYKIIEISN